MENKEGTNTVSNYNEATIVEHLDPTTDQITTNSVPQVAGAAASNGLPESKVNTSAKDSEVILKVSAESANAIAGEDTNKNQILERMNSSESSRLPMWKARNTSMNKSVKGNYHVAVQRDKLDSYRFYKNRYQGNELANAEAIRKHSESISDYYPSNSSASFKRESFKHKALMTANSGSFEDDVFSTNSKISRMESDSSCSSTTRILENPYNNINYKIHSFLWCPCMFLFYICCCPAVFFMSKSDNLYKENYPDKSKSYAKISTVLYILGTVFALLFYTGLFALIIVLVK
ncbi:hypothetical protein Ahia01_001056700 [Argonauta hians]